MELLLNITIKSTLILLLSGSILWMLKNASATLRHWIISLTMIGLLGLPFLLSILPALTVTIPYLPVKHKTPLSNPTTVEEILMAPVKINQSKSSLKSSTGLIEKTTSTKDLFLEDVNNQLLVETKRGVTINEHSFLSFSKVLLSIWFLGMVFFLIKLLIGRYLIREITIKSEPFLLPEKTQNQLIGLTSKKVNILISRAIKTPMTWGGFKPVILLPETAYSWSDLALKTVLLHEFNHIKRNDYWLHTLGLLSVCFYWYNPLIWLMKKQQLLEREKACDEAVLNAGIQQQNYAEQLVNITRQLSGQTTILQEHALPMAKISQTKARIIAILKFDQQKFQFPKWKQRNWGLFYVCLVPILAAFTPVGIVIHEHFDLPKLEAVNSFLVTNQKQSIIIPNHLFLKARKESSTVQELSISETEKIAKEPFIHKIPSLDLLEKKHVLLSHESPKEKINAPLKLPQKGLFGKWKEGKSEFTIWTYGAFKIIPTAPYIEVLDSDGIVFIQEYIPGLFRDKMNQLTIGKASVDGRMGVGYKGKLSTLITKGTPIKVWSDNTNYERWMATKGKELPAYLLNMQQEKVIQEVTAENDEWKRGVEGAKKWLNGFFIPEEKRIKQIEIEDRRLVLDLGGIPYKELSLSQRNRVPMKMGRITLPENGNDGTIGTLSTNPNGIKYVTVLKGNTTPALIKDFNFHLAENDFKNVKFSLQLYNIVNGEIGYAITKQPISLTLEDGQKGWIKIDLSTYNIVTKGDVLVVFTNNGFSGNKRRKKLYFSFAENHHHYQPLLVDKSWKTKIWEKAFAMYLGVEQTLEGVGQIENQKNNGYLVEWKEGKSDFRIWTYGAFKIIEEAPYIEVVSPDGMVIIEENKAGLFSNNVHKLVVMKAPYDGTYRWDYKNKTPLAELPIIKKGSPIQFWSKYKKLENWLADNKTEITIKLQEKKVRKKVTFADTKWWDKIQNEKEWIDFHFVSKAIIDAKIERKRRRAELQSGGIPYQKLDYPNQKGQVGIIGRTALSGKDVGNTLLKKSLSPKGTQYITVLKGNNQPALVKEFNFHLSKNDFTDLSFELQLYNVVDGEVKYAITKSPIPFRVKNGTGWIKKDLSDYGIVTQGDVLVVLENKDFSGGKNDKGLYFSLIDDYEAYEAIISSNFEWKTRRILERAFVMNLGVE